MKSHVSIAFVLILVLAVLAGCTGMETALLTQSASSVTAGPASPSAASQNPLPSPGTSKASQQPKPSGGPVMSQTSGSRPIPGSAPGDTGKTVSQQVGLVVNSADASEGYTLLAPKHYTSTYLIDNAGKIVNTWKSGYLPGQSAYLLENGHLLRSCFTRNQAFIGGGEGGGLEEYDWEGNLVWEFWYSSDKYLMHHDIKPLPNGNVLALAVEKKTLDECAAAGFQTSSFQEKYLYPDTVIEIRPTGPASGEIVWEWHVWDHLVQDDNQAAANYGNVSAHPELIDVECNAGRQTVAFWNHMNAIDYNPALDQILLSVRGCSEIWIIDHSTTRAEAAGHSGGKSGRGGDLVYRWGNPQAYGMGSAGSQQLFQQHDAQWIKPGLPGAGHILIYNNGLSRPGGACSSVDEIVPPVGKDGKYVLASGTYGPASLLWTYMASPSSSLYSEAISGCQRLPNGNTLICDGVKGVILEVSASSKTVWQYVNPVIATGPVKQGTAIPLDDRGHQLNAVFKAQRYAPGFPGFAGKALVAGDAIVK